MGTPLLLLNLKAYPGCLGDGALRIGRLLEALGRAYGVSVALAAAAPDLSRLARELTIPILAEHADPEEAGARTGWLVPESLAASGVRGSLVNHSERPLPPEIIHRTVQRLQATGLVPVVCAREEKEAEALARSAHPPYLAVEPPDLIGGKVSVAKARPETVFNSVLAVRAAWPATHVLVGAGVQGPEDVRKALQLGAEGILVASAVATSPDPARALRSLLSGFP